MPRTPASRELHSALASGHYRMHVAAPGASDADIALACRDDLCVRVMVRPVQQLSQVDLAPAFLQFLSSGSIEGRYADKACITVEKFGSPVQFKEDVHVRFWRTR